jgi:hypothetical protein
MKPQWILLILGAGLYVLALFPGAIPHRADMQVMIISGMLIASVSILGFDHPYPHKKMGVALLTIGCVLFLSGVLMAIFKHPYILFVTIVPSLGLVLFGIRLQIKRDT